MRATKNPLVKNTRFYWGFLKSQAPEWITHLPKYKKQAPEWGFSSPVSKSSVT